MSFTHPHNKLGSPHISSTQIQGTIVAKFDKYLLSQLMVFFGFFALVLVLVYWVNRAVILFDQLIANGHSALVFLEFSALTLPAVILLVLPIAAFAASVYCANRMVSERELVVVQSTGFSPYRLIRPVLVFGLLVGLMLSVLSHILVPASITQLSLRKGEIEAKLTARLLQEGIFLHPANGITFYIREISSDGTLLDIFLADSRDSEAQTTYSARRAVLLPAADGPKLVMFDGMAQELRKPANTLSTTVYSEFTFDIGALVSPSQAKRPKPQELSTPDLFWPTQENLDATKSTAAFFLQQGHERVSQAILCVVVSIIGFSAILMGGHSRFSLWKQVIAAIAILIGIKTLDNFMNDLARQDAGSWPLVYLASALGFVTAYIMLWLASRPVIFARRHRRSTP